MHGQGLHRTRTWAEAIVLRFVGAQHVFDLGGVSSVVSLLVVDLSRERRKEDFSFRCPPRRGLGMEELGELLREFEELLAYVCR